MGLRVEGFGLGLRVWGLKPTSELEDALFAAALGLGAARPYYTILYHTIPYYTIKTILYQKNHASLLCALCPLLHLKLLRRTYCDVVL